MDHVGQEPAYRGRAAEGVDAGEEQLDPGDLVNWADPLYDQGHLTLDALDELRSEASVIHRQLNPVWRRKVNRSRPAARHPARRRAAPVRLGLMTGRRGHWSWGSLRGPAPGRTSGGPFPAERAVTLALGTPGVTTWPEAAMAAGAARPEIQGEKGPPEGEAARCTHHRPLSRGRGDHGERPMSALNPVSARPARRREVVLRIAPCRVLRPAPRYSAPAASARPWYTAPPLPRMALPCLRQSRILGRHHRRGPLAAGSAGPQPPPGPVPQPHRRP